jgi:asparaginyl-tRNA synthetase
MTSVVGVAKAEQRGGCAAPGSWRRPATHFLEAMQSDWYRAIFHLQSDIALHTERFFRGQGIPSTMLPITTTSISSPMGLGSDSLPVSVTLDGKETYLADSMQFMLEYAVRLNGKGAFYIMPSFRGEVPDARHLNQFYHSEAEICGGLEDVVDLVSQYVHHLAEGLLETSREQLLIIATEGIDHIEAFADAGGNIPSVRFSDAVEQLKMDPRFVEVRPEGFATITNSGEREIISRYGGPVWLTNMPSLSVPFYQADEENSDYSLTADLLMGIGETVGAGERHTTEAEVLAALERRHVGADPYRWYLDMKRTRPLHTSGFGMGVERFICWLAGHDDIRDCQILPRLYGVDIVP